MKGKRHSYPLFEGSANVNLNGKKFSIQINGRAVTVSGKESDLSSIIPKLPLRLKSIGTARNASRLISNAGVTLTLNDEKGAVLSAGKGIWTPLGHFSFRPRFRKYLKGGDSNK